MFPALLAAAPAVLGALGGGGGGPSNAEAVSASPFNSSGWSVAFGNARAGAAGDAAGAAAGPDQLGQYLPWVALALAAVVAYRMLKK